MFNCTFDLPIRKLNLYGTFAPVQIISGNVVIKFWVVLSPEVQQSILQYKGCFLDAFL